MFNITSREQVIINTWYGGEMKKGMFSMMNYYRLQQILLPVIRLIMPEAIPEMEVCINYMPECLFHYYKPSLIQHFVYG